jgi:hypothetical protein
VQPGIRESPDENHILTEEERQNSKIKGQSVVQTQRSTTKEIDVR